MVWMEDSVRSWSMGRGVTEVAEDGGGGRH